MESADDRTAMDGESSAPADAASELEKLRREVADKNDRLLRALAEADNIRRRAQRDREDAVRYAAEGLVRDLIPVLDNLDRALDAARAAGDVSAIVNGVELIRREVMKALERHGVTRYSALGQRFDPNQHEAIARVVSLDKAPDTVVGETAAGY